VQSRRCDEAGRGGTSSLTIIAFCILFTITTTRQPWRRPLLVSRSEKSHEQHPLHSSPQQQNEATQVRMLLKGKKTCRWLCYGQWMHHGNVFVFLIVILLMVNFLILYYFSYSQWWRCLCLIARGDHCNTMRSFVKQSVSYGAHQPAQRAWANTNCKILAQEQKMAHHVLCVFEPWQDMVQHWFYKYRSQEWLL
jgi:hypothetical protein